MDKKTLMVIDRGWPREAYIRALDQKNQENITWYHPANYLTEDEVESGDFDFLMRNGGQ